MKTLPDSLVADTLKSLDIEVWEEKGDELVALCPGHKARTGKEDNHPSWSINEETGVHYCFSCGYRGNLYTLVRDVKGDEPAKVLWSEFEIHGRPVTKDEVKTIINKPKPGTFRSANTKPESWLSDFVPPPDWALSRRRILAAGAAEYEVLWDTENDSWILPFRETESRRLMGYQSKSEKKREFRNRPMRLEKARTLFGWPVVEKETRIVVVESPLDAVLLADLGAPAVALCGSRISDEQAALLRDFDQVLVWMDADKAGELEVQRLRENRLSLGIPMTFMTPDLIPDWEKHDWKDVGDMPYAAIDAALDAARF